MKIRTRTTLLPLLLLCIISCGLGEIKSKSKIYKGKVLNKQLIVTNNWWNGTQGNCIIKLKLFSSIELTILEEDAFRKMEIQRKENKIENGRQITLSLWDWEDCMRIEEGDEIELFKVRYRSDSVKKWKGWKVK